MSFEFVPRKFAKKSAVARQTENDAKFARNISEAKFNKAISDEDCLLYLQLAFSEFSLTHDAPLRNLLLSARQKSTEEGSVCKLAWIVSSKSNALHSHIIVKAVEGFNLL
jgi:hypothetical protein